LTGVRNGLAFARKCPYETTVCVRKTSRRKHFRSISGGGGVPIGDGGLGQRPPRARFVAASGRILPGRASEPPPPPHGGNRAHLAREETSEGMEGRGGVGGVGWWG
jgi:hypothetical protein